MIDFERKYVFMLNPKCGSRFLFENIKCIQSLKHFSSLLKNKKLNPHHLKMEDVIDLIKEHGHNPRAFEYFVLIRNPVERLISSLKYSMFDKNWIPKYYSNNSVACFYDYSPEKVESYKKKYNLIDTLYNKKRDENYDINEYVRDGYNRTSVFMSHPLPLNEFMILDQDYKINVFKLEEIEKFLEFLKSRNYKTKNIKCKINSADYNKEKALSVITDETKSKIREIFAEDYKYYED
jgi:hypothetical protein